MALISAQNLEMAYGDQVLLVVVLNSNDRFGRYTDARNLFRWGFRQRSAGGK